MIEPYEQFKLSLCSKRMHFVVKNYRLKSSMFLNLRGSKNHTNVCLFCPKYSVDEVTFLVKGGYIYCWETNNIEESQYRLKQKTERIFSCENIIKGTKFLVEFLGVLFAVKVKKVEVTDNTTWMLDFVEERQGAFSYDAEVWSECARTDEQLRHILLDLNPRSLEFDQKTSDEFRIENFHKKYENLTIYRGTWVTVENLYQLDCVKIEINLKFFSNAEINRYLKHVLSGGAPRLREFLASDLLPPENKIMDGIQELLTESERSADDGFGNWKVIGKVARGEEVAMVSIEATFQNIHLEIKEA